MMYDDLSRMLDELIAEIKDEWIPVSERLPDNNVRVLCSAISTSISGGCTRFVGCCNNGYWFVQTDAETVSYPRQYKVIAWMPLPEPYHETCKGCIEPCIMYEPDMRGCKKKVTERGEADGK